MVRNFLVTLDDDDAEDPATVEDLRIELRLACETLPPWVGWHFVEWQDPAQTQLDVSGE